MNTQYAPPPLAEIESALYSIPPDLERDQWAQAGMALASELGEAGFELFDKWSRGGNSYKPSDTRSTWRSVIRGSGIRIGSLFFIAKQYGYNSNNQSTISPEEESERKRLQQERADVQLQYEKARGEQNQKALRKVWSDSTSLNYCSDTPAHRYLKNRLAGHDIPGLSDDLLYCPELPYWNDGVMTIHPGLIAMVRSPKGKPVTLHRTYITEEGGKAAVASPKKLMGTPFGMSITGGSICIGKPEGKVIIAEGLETALSLSLALDLPSFSTISPHGLRTFAPPAEITEAVVGVDNDISGTGQKAAKDLSDRLIELGITVKRLTPDKPGTDWCDFINEVQK